MTAGVTIRGTVEYADQLQILVKWDNGRSSSLRVGRDRFRVASPGQELRDNRGGVKFENGKPAGNQTTLPRLRV